MPILATLRQDRAGEWTNLDDYLRELRHRETGALAALANALSAPSHEQKELAEHGEAGAILLEVACDLWVPKGTRLAASRALQPAIRKKARSRGRSDNTRAENSACEIIGGIQ